MKTLMKGIIAATMLVTPAMADEYGDSDRIIHEKCAQDWPTDYSMRAYCEKLERAGLQELKQNNPPRASASETGE